MTRYVAVTRGFRYPVGASLDRVREAGGVSKLPDDEKKALAWKEVGIGDDCSDMPVESLALYLQRGDVAILEGFLPAKMTDFGKGEATTLHGSERVIPAKAKKGKG